MRSMSFYIINTKNHVVEVRRLVSSPNHEICHAGDTVCRHIYIYVHIHKYIPIKTASNSHVVFSLETIRKYEDYT